MRGLLAKESVSEYHREVFKQTYKTDNGSQPDLNIDHIFMNKGEIEIMKQRTIWLVLIVLIAANLACDAPFNAGTIKGSGNVVTEERNVNDFDSVAMSGFGRVIVTQGDEESLTVETDDNLMQYIETRVSGGTLELGFTDDAERKILDPSDSIIFRLSVIDLTALDISGAAAIEIQKLEADRLDMVLSGAGDVRIDSLTATDLVVTVSGAGDVELTGQVETQEIALRGLGNYDASDLESQDATVRIGGAGSATVWAHDTLDIEIGGAGNVEYYGDPDVTQDISGAGSITSRGDK